MRYNATIEEVDSDSGPTLISLSQHPETNLISCSRLDCYRLHDSAIFPASPMRTHLEVRPTRMRSWVW